MDDDRPEDDLIFKISKDKAREDRAVREQSAPTAVKYDGLEIWTVYQRPIDYPNCYVARRFYNEQPTNEVLLCSEPEPLQDWLRAKGLTRLARDPSDDPVIVESWI